jgi:hypothetical protein
MSNQQAIPPNSMGQQFTEGTPVYDMKGEQIGTVSRHGLAGNVLILYKGISFHRDIQVPLSTVQRSETHGIYLSVLVNAPPYEQVLPSILSSMAIDRLISRSRCGLSRTIFVNSSYASRCKAGAEGSNAFSEPANIAAPCSDASS